MSLLELEFDLRMKIKERVAHFMDAASPQDKQALAQYLISMRQRINDECAKAYEQLVK